MRVCLPIDPAWQVELSGRLARATRTSESGVSSTGEIELANVFEWALERQPYYPTLGCEVERSVLVGSGSRCDEAITRIRYVD